MMKFLGFAVGLCMATTAFSQVNTLTLKDLQVRVNNHSDTLYVVNLWATWCSPCVAELPHFEKLNQEYSPKKVKVLLLSLDFLQNLSKLEKFAVNKNLKSEVFLLNETNPTDWMGKIDEDWSGSIPATVLFQKGKKVAFHEGDFSWVGLKSFIKSYIP
jgi:thiol-disulfide isomerase/thioredoxin